MERLLQVQSVLVMTDTALLTGSSMMLLNTAVNQWHSSEGALGAWSLMLSSVQIYSDLAGCPTLYWHYALLTDN